MALGPAAATTPSPLSGDWLTADHQAVISVAPCGADLCGRIAGMVLAPGAAAPLDWRGQKQCGETIIHVSETPQGWRGTVLDPRNGSVWQATLALADAQDLHLRGYVLTPLLGQTQTWQRYTGTPPVGCRLPQG